MNFKQEKYNNKICSFTMFSKIFIISVLFFPFSYITEAVQPAIKTRGEEIYKNLSYEIILQNRSLNFTEEETKKFFSFLTRYPRPTLHAYVKLRKYPKPVDIKILEKDGINLVSFISDRVYFAAIPKNIKNKKFNNHPLIEAFAEIKLEDKINPDIAAGDFSKFIVYPEDRKPMNYVLNPDGTINLTVKFFNDISEKTAKTLFNQLKLSPKQTGRGLWTITVQKLTARVLASNDEIERVDAGHPPFLPDNDLTRAVLSVNTVQNAVLTATSVAYTLDGTGVQVGVDEGRRIDETHPDFAGRVIVHQPHAGAHGKHATHVAGIIGASGVQSNQNNINGIPNGGAPFQWRGMAPNAQLIDSSDLITTSNAYTAIASSSMDVSNHSYSYSFDGNYSAGDAQRDREIRGDETYTAGTTTFPISARPQAYSAGNHGNIPNNGGEQVGYYATTKQNKNGIMIGNWNSSTTAPTISGGSSIGPAYDGRIKPDVVAPGTTIVSAGTLGAVNDTACYAGDNRNGYGLCSGTSMSTPAVTGVVALMLQQYATTTGANIDSNPPFPSTLKSILIDTANDIDWATAAPAGYAYPATCALGLPNNPARCNADGPVVFFPGPDFPTGWGMVNAEQAINTIQTQNFFEDEINMQGQVRETQFTVATTSPFRVTLAWDDVEGNTAIANTVPHLVNDLDFELVAPDGTVYYPWQLNQTITNGAGIPIPNADQYPGTLIQVQTTINPTTTPQTCGWGTDPAVCVNQNDYPGTIPVTAAGTGKDHLNNVEQIFVASPVMMGAWTLKVMGFNIPGPTTTQPYSIAGISAAGNLWPDISPIGDITLDEGEILSIPINSADPDGEIPALTAEGLPFFANILDNGDGTGTLTVSPGCSNAGIYNGIQIIATDSGIPQKSEGEFITITVNDTLNCVDTMLVLDRSGSMGWSVPLGTSTIIKMNSLKNSVDLFANLFVTERPNSPDNLGIVQFAANTPTDTQTIRSLADVSLPDVLAGGAVNDTIFGLTTDATTWIRGGLQLGLNELFASSTDSLRKKAIILFSDGKENVSPLVQEPPPDPSGILSDSNFASTTVYAVGFGQVGALNDSGIDEELLQTIQNVGLPDGFINVTADPLGLTKFFVDALANIFDQSIILDPITTLSGSGPSLQPVVINSNDNQVTFLLTWAKSEQNAFDLSLRTPAGEIITSSDAAKGTPIEFYSGNTYKYFIVRFPLNGRLSGNYAGTWQMQINHGESSSQSQFATAVMSDSPLSLTVEKPKIITRKGDTITLRAALKESGKPILGAKVTGIVNRPTISLDDLLSRYKKDPKQFKIPLILAKDPPSNRDLKLLNMIQDKKYSADILSYKKESFELFDDGKHRDGKARDGIYANSFLKTKVEGSYKFKLQASGKSFFGNRFTRESEFALAVIKKQNAKNSKMTKNNITKINKKTVSMTLP